MDEIRRMDAEEARRLRALDVRQVFGETMGRLARSYPLLSVVVSDYGRRLALDGLRLAEPDALVQCGIAEQNQIEVAAALANEGGPVFAVSYAPFITARVLDQIRVNLGMMESPVILVGLGAGYAVGELGASHMGLEDIADLRAIPNITVVSPRDNAELVLALEELAAHPRPAYVRITTGEAMAGEASFALGRPVLLHGGEGEPQVALLAAGTLCTQALGAAAILEGQGVSCVVAEISTIKPLCESFLEELPSCRLWVSVEEHTLIGGLGSAVAEYLAERGTSTALLRCAAPDAYLEADTQQELRRRAGLDAEGIAASVLRRLGQEQPE